MDDNQLLRIGRISSINYADGTARVTYRDKDGCTTPEFPFLDWGWRPPKIGEQVLVAHLSNSTARGVILGPIWYGRGGLEDRLPLAADSSPMREELNRWEYSHDIAGPGMEYDHKEKTMLRNAAGLREYAEEQEERTTLETGGCTIVLEKGAITIEAPKGITITTESSTSVRTNQDVVSGSDSISLIHHTHMGVHGVTTPPLPGG